MSLDVYTSLPVSFVTVVIYSCKIFMTFFPDVISTRMPSWSMQYYKNRQYLMLDFLLN
jgi:hypothetical protein